MLPKSILKIFVYSILLLIVPNQSILAQTENGMHSKVLRVGYDEAYPPFQFTDQNGRASGFDIDLIKAVAKVSGYQLYFEAGTWFEIKDRLERGEIDVIPGVNINPGRKLKFAVTVPTMVTFHQFFVREGSKIKSLSDIKSDTSIQILIQNNQVLTDYLKELNPFVKLRFTENTQEGLRNLSAGEGDAILLPERSGQYYIDYFKLSNLKPAFKPILPREYAIAVKAGDSAMLLGINRGLGIIENTGAYSEAYAKWFAVYDDTSFFSKYF
jgi:ABC-type amino acid transport substrate-binding protein